MVDMGGGSGHLAIPAALLHPAHRIVVIDLNRRSIDLLKVKAARAVGALVEEEGCRRHEQQQQQHEVENEEGANDLKSGDDGDDDFVASHPALPLEPTAIPNLYALCGSIEQFLLGPNECEGLAFHVGLALHLCGQSTDVAIRACLRQRAALVAAPCCVGKISTAKRNPYVWQATRSNASSARARNGAAGPSGSGGNPPGSRSNNVRPARSVVATSSSLNSYGPIACMPAG